jgi:enoyl-CoA hydratase/carnithine racemase
MTAASPLVIDRSSPAWRLTLSKPPVNALDIALITALRDSLRAADTDPACRVVVLASDQKAFCAGADINFMRSADPTDLATFRNLVRDTFSLVEDVRVPVVGVVEGLALGGGFELLLACDIVIAAETGGGLLGLPEVTLGLLPGGGGTQRLTQAVGKSKATELLFSGRRLTATEAHRLGLVTHVAAPAEVSSLAAEAVSTLATGPTAAYAAIKRCIRAALSADREVGLDVEQSEAAGLVETVDAQAAMTGFVTRSAVEFTGH